MLVVKAVYYIRAKKEQIIYVVVNDYLKHMHSRMYVIMQLLFVIQLSTGNYVFFYKYIFMAVSTSLSVGITGQRLGLLESYVHQKVLCM